MHHLSLKAFSAKTETCFLGKVRLWLERFWQKRIPEYDFCLHPVHSAYDLMMFVMSVEQILYLGLNMLFFSIIWQ